MFGMRFTRHRGRRSRIDHRPSHGDHGAGHHGGIVIATAPAPAAASDGGPFGGFGPFGFGPGGGPRGRGRKARRGDIRTAALLLLNEEPRNGYQIMQEVQERSDGVWRPSPGSVIPGAAAAGGRGPDPRAGAGWAQAVPADRRGPRVRQGARRGQAGAVGADERRCLRPGARAGQVDPRGRLRLHAGGEDRQRGADGRGSQGARRRRGKTCTGSSPTAIPARAIPRPVSWARTPEPEPLTLEMPSVLNHSDH